MFRLNAFAARWARISIPSGHLPVPFDFVSLLAVLFNPAVMASLFVCDGDGPALSDLRD
jgi:hypothetical protein